MPTIRQKKVAKKLVENLNAEQPLNKKEILVSSGYSEITADSSAKIILESEGVKEELKTVYGFDPDTAKNVVADILIGGEEDRDRLKAADMIFKVHGSYAAEKHANFNVNYNTTDSKLDALIAKIEDELDA
jgi:hypothetical protein